MTELTRFDLERERTQKRIADALERIATVMERQIERRDEHARQGEDHEER